ncbi:hypothetical protein GCM10023201_30500 [Actinomycetospora corticicola]|uniref:RNA polymerase sigma factor (Sigma-70 family) n=1 Tax=Actinomycetospora corticicola TaxID=663602 RepID=A0A7Y9J4X6_9PSEU|nr:RNA polymerase sigma factor (sigma-70 family) [Actinomycetospora corticicola]
MTDPLNDPRELDRLVAAALTGERGAMNTLLRILRPLVVRYCRSRLGGYDRVNASPDDVAQEVCLAVLRALPTYQDQGRPFLAFVYGIAQHKVVDAHRSAGRDRSDPVDELPEEQDVHDGPEQHAVNLSDSVEMAALMAELPEKQREVLRLRVVVGLSAEETAEAVGSTAGAVRVAQHRALTRLRQLIIERGDHPPAPDAGPAAPPRRRGGTRGPRRRAAAEPVATVAVGAPPTEAVDWHSAPRTGHELLDRLLDAADAHVLAAASEGPDGTAGPVGVTDRGVRQDVLAAEDARMAAVAARWAPPR